MSAIPFEHDGVTVKAVNPAMRKQPPVIRTKQVPEQARLLWQALRTVAQERPVPMEAGYYWEGDLAEVAKSLFPGVAWDHAKHASNFLRPILGVLQSSGNMNILGRLDGHSKHAFHYKIWVREDWRIISRGSGRISSDNGYSTRASGIHIKCPCGKVFLSSQGYSQHRKGCYAIAEAQKAAAVADEVETDDVPMPEGMPGVDYRAAMEGRRWSLQLREANERINQLEIVLKDLKRDWVKRTPDSLARIFDNLDNLNI